MEGHGTEGAAWVSSMVEQHLGAPRPPERAAGHPWQAPAWAAQPGSGQQHSRKPHPQQQQPPAPTDAPTRPPARPPASQPASTRPPTRLALGGCPRASGLAPPDLQLHVLQLDAHLQGEEERKKVGEKSGGNAVRGERKAAEAAGFCWVSSLPFCLSWRHAHQRQARAPSQLLGPLTEPVCPPATSTELHPLAADHHPPTHQQEVDSAQHCVAHVVGPPLIFKLNVQAVLDAHLHLQAGEGGEAYGQ